MKSLSESSDFYFKKDFQSYRRLFILGMFSIPDNSDKYEEWFGFDPDEITESLAWEIQSQIMEMPEIEEINFLETEKAKNSLKSELKRKDVNQRGRFWRPKYKTDEFRCSGKPCCPPSDVLDDGDDDLEIPSNGNNQCENPFLCEGMTVVISKEGVTGAVCFNTRYFGNKIIKE